MSKNVAGSAGKVLGGLAAVAILGSAFLDWQDVPGPPSAKGTEVPVEFLVDKGADSGSPSILLVLGIAAALIAVGVFLARAHRFSTFVGALLAIVVVVLYCVQVQRVLDSTDTNLSLTDFIGIGTYVALVGGLVGLIAAFMPSGHESADAPATAPAPAAATDTAPPAASAPEPEPAEPATPPADAPPEA